jgi:superfamily II DNA helicase RecQ
VQELFKRPGVSFRVARKFGAEIVDLIVAAGEEDPTILDSPSRPTNKPLNSAARHSLELLKKWRQEKSEELKLPVGVVFPANLLESLVAAPPANLDEFMAFPGMRRWRALEFGGEILQTFLNEEGRL